MLYLGSSDQKNLWVSEESHAELKTRNNEVIKLSEAKGVVTLVAFWATWCGACQVELPTIARLYENLKNKGFKVVAVNVGENLPANQVDDIWTSMKMPFDYYMDHENKTSEFFDVSALPANFVIDKYDKVVLSSYGANDWSHLKYVDMVSNLLIE